MNRQAPDGFTLIELLVVIAIIAVLAAIIIPVASGTLEASRQARCAGNLRQWGVATQSYIAENNGCFPTVSYSVGYESKVGPYLKDGGSEDTLRRVGHCPSHTEKNVGTKPSYSYRANYYITTPKQNGSPIRVTDIRAPEPNPFGHVMSPSRAVLFFEVHTHAELINNDAYWGGGGKAPYWPAWANSPHRGEKWNFLMVDGHVETVNGSALKSGEFSAWERIGPPSVGRNN
jgi:prepilin-type N-terminal cleavage/methylation domain-containing protein/prepilin-type processing-associated H-X9-DG protein